METKTSVFEEEGRVWMRGLLDEAELSLLDRACALESLPGQRLDWSADLRAAAGAESRLTQAARRLSAGVSPVRILVFNKSSAMNWNVPWHQDRVIAVEDRHALEGYRAWTRKSGVWHVEPPLGILQDMLFARVHLDDNDSSNGCLEVALGTHKFGRIAAGDAQSVAENAEVEASVARRGDVLFVKALALHRSSSSTRSSHRRTLRMDYSAQVLPTPLKWALEEGQ